MNDQADMNKVSISHIGLADKDIRLIHNLCRLSVSSMNNFHLLDKSGDPGGNILLIDIDNPESAPTYRKIAQFKKFQSVISITKKRVKPTEGNYVISRPLVLRKITEALEMAISQNRIESSTHDTQYSVLVTDDALPVRTFMKQKLHDMLPSNVSVDAACDGMEALHLCSASKYNLVFMDVMMPGLDGYKTCKEIKSKYKTPVVMLTSKSSTLNKVKAKMSGCDGYITKPPSDQELSRTLNKFVPELLTDSAFSKFSNNLSAV